jgi:hypothetical protein
MAGQVIEDVLPYLTVLIEEQFRRIALRLGKLGDAFVGQRVIIVANMYVLCIHETGTLNVSNGGFDDGEDNCQYQDGHRYVTVAQRILYRNGDTTVHLVDQPSHETAPAETYQDVARIVDAQIKACIAVDERPAYQEDGEQSLPNK